MADRGGEMKTHIQEIRLQNFRAFERARLSLDELTFLVGRNGAGKSSILDAVEFMREAVTDSLPNALDRRGGFGNVIRVGAPEDVPLGLALRILAEPSGRPTVLLYGFQIWPSGRIREVLAVEGKSTLGFRREDDSFETGVRGISSAVPPHRLVLPLVVQEGLWSAVWSTLAAMRTYQLAPDAIAESDEIGRRTDLLRDGRNAGDVLFELQNRRTGEWTLFNQILGQVADGLSGVEATLQMRRRIIQARRTLGDSSARFDSLQLSSGTLRSIGILLALFQRPRPSLLMVDEVEDSIHPHAIGALLEVAEATASGFPVVITTHSPEVLATEQVRPERVRIVQWARGTSHLHGLSQGSVESVDPLNSVGDLLRFNSLWPSEEQEDWHGDLLELDG